MEKKREYQVITNDNPTSAPEAAPPTEGDWKKQTLRLLFSRQARYIWAIVALLVVLRVGINAWNHRAVLAVVPQVSIVHPDYRAIDSELNLPGNIEALEQANLFAHVSGYLKKIYVRRGRPREEGGRHWLKSTLPISCRTTIKPRQLTTSRR